MTRTTTRELLTRLTSGQVRELRLYCLFVPGQTTLCGHSQMFKTMWYQSWTGSICTKHTGIHFGCHTELQDKISHLVALQQYFKIYMISIFFTHELMEFFWAFDIILFTFQSDVWWLCNQKQQTDKVGYELLPWDNIALMVAGLVLWISIILVLYNTITQAWFIVLDDVWQRQSLRNSCWMISHRR